MEQQTTKIRLPLPWNSKQQQQQEEEDYHYHGIANNYKITATAQQQTTRLPLL